MMHVANEKGVALIAAVATLLILSLMAVVVVSLVGTESYSALDQAQSLQAFDLAEAGAHRALSYLSREGGTCTAITGAAQFTNVAVGRGTFTVTATHYNPTSTTLSAGITASSTTIPVSSTANFAPHGRIYIEYPPPVVDAVSTGQTSVATTITISHTTTGTDRLMIVGVAYENAQAGNQTVTGVTYSGQALTEVGHVFATQDSRVYLWQLIAPPTGTANAVITFSSIPNKGAVAGVITFTGVNQTTPLGTFTSATGNGTTPTVDVTSAKNELVIDTISESDGTLTMGANQAQRWNINQADVWGGGSTEPGAATVTMSWSQTTTKPWAIGAVSVKPVTPTEGINYVDATAGSFTGALRGVAGTTASSHSSGAVVTQDLCLITSTGTVAGTSGPAKRVVEVGVEYP